MEKKLIQGGKKDSGKQEVKSIVETTLDVLKDKEINGNINIGGMQVIVNGNGNSTKIEVNRLSIEEIIHLLRPVIMFLLLISGTVFLSIMVATAISPELRTDPTVMLLFTISFTLCLLLGYLMSYPEVLRGSPI